MARNSQRITIVQSEFVWNDRVALAGGTEESEIKYKHLCAQVFQIEKNDLNWAWVIWYANEDEELHVNISKGWHIPTIKEAKEAVKELLKVLVKRAKYTSDY